MECEMKAPLVAVSEEQLIRLDESDFGNRFKGGLLYDAILYVHQVHDGEPSAHDGHKVTATYDLAGGIVNEGSITLICTRVDDTRAFAIHFPSDQQEVEFIADDDDDDDDEDDDDFFA